jgi:alkylhydroperoxidase/carboxymuconolactone decarboxylase family protein
MEEYYKREDLPKFGEIGKEAPQMAKKYFEYYNEVFSEGELTLREKSLIALAVAHAIQCPYCIDSFTQSCLERGSNMGEMTEAVHVASAIRGGASLVHGIQARNIADKLSM